MMSYLCLSSYVNVIFVFEIECPQPPAKRVL